MQVSITRYDHTAQPPVGLDACARSPETDITSVDGIPCTTALRTVIDIAAELEGHEVERIVDECRDRGVFRPREAGSEPATSARLIALGV
jgi:hypothetical protein